MRGRVPTTLGCVNLLQALDAPHLRTGTRTDTSVRSWLLCRDTSVTVSTARQHLRREHTLEGPMLRGRVCAGGEDEEEREEDKEEDSRATGAGSSAEADTHKCTDGHFPGLACDLLGERAFHEGGAGFAHFLHTNCRTAEALTSAIARAPLSFDVLFKDDLCLPVLRCKHQHGFHWPTFRRGILLPRGPRRCTQHVWADAFCQQFLNGLGMTVLHCIHEHLAPLNHPCPDRLLSNGKWGRESAIAFRRIAETPQGQVT